ncbi:hypothetical protein MJK72_21115 [Klebsiella pneumoniae]|nr:hypothetical protein MJK72_21115 [Klebsiella pneumoniae]
MILQRPYPKPAELPRPLIAGGLLATTPRFVNLIKRFGGAFDNGERRCRFCGSRWSQSFETNEHAGHVLAPLPPGPDGYGSERRLGVLLLVIEEVIFTPSAPPSARLLLGAAARLQLDRGGEHPAILQRQERGRQMQKQEHHPAERDDVDPASSAASGAIFCRRRFRSGWRCYGMKVQLKTSRRSLFFHGIHTA